MEGDGLDGDRDGLVAAIQGELGLPGEHTLVSFK